jgi:hypothetical protein
VNGVVPLAATAISASCVPIACRWTSAAASSASSSAPSTARSHQQHEARGRPSEGRHQLGAVLHREPPRGAGAGINEAPAAAQALLDRQRGAFERRARGVHRGDRGELTLQHRIEDVGRTPQIDRRIARAWSFGLHLSHTSPPSSGKRAPPTAGSTGSDGSSDQGSVREVFGIGVASEPRARDMTENVLATSSTRRRSASASMPRIFTAPAATLRYPAGPPAT